MQLINIHLILVLFNLLFVLMLVAISFFGNKELVALLARIGAISFIASFLIGYYIVKRGLKRARERQKDGKLFFTESLLDDEEE